MPPPGAARSGRAPSAPTCPLVRALPSLSGFFGMRPRTPPPFGAARHWRPAFSRPFGQPLFLASLGRLAVAACGRPSRRLRQPPALSLTRSGLPCASCGYSPPLGAGRPPLLASFVGPPLPRLSGARLRRAPPLLRTGGRPRRPTGGSFRPACPPCLCVLSAYQQGRTASSRPRWSG